MTGSGTTYNVAVSGMTGSGTVIATVAAGVAHDAVGNPNCCLHYHRQYGELRGRHTQGRERGGGKRCLERQLCELPGRAEPRQRRRLFHPGRQRRQLLPLPWTNIDEIKVTFNENVTVDQTDLMLEGVNTPSYNVAGGTFAYNAATFTATWTLPAAIPDDKLLLELECRRRRTRSRTPWAIGWTASGATRF